MANQLINNTKIFDPASSLTLKDSSSLVKDLKTALNPALRSLGDSSYQLDLSYLNGAVDGKYQLAYEGLSLSIEKKEGAYSLKMEPDSASIALVGGIEAKSFLFEGGNVNLALDGPVADSVTILANKITLETSAHYTQLSLDAKETIEVAAPIKLKNIDVKAKEIICNAPFSAEETHFIASDSIEINAALHSKTLVLESQTLKQKSMLSGEKLNIQATKEIVNQGQIYGHEHLSLKGGSFVNQGHCFSPHTLSVDFDSCVSKKGSTLRGQVMFELQVSDHWINEGEWISDTNAFVKVKKLENKGKMSWGERFYAHIDSLSGISGSRFVMTDADPSSEKKHRELHIEKDLCLAENAEFVIEAAHFVAETAELSGSFTAKKSFVDLQNCSVEKSGRVRIDQVLLSCDEQFILAEGSVCALEASSLKAKEQFFDGHLIASKGSYVHKADLVEVGLTGSLEFKESGFEAEQLNHAGKIQVLEGSQFKINQDTLLQNRSELILEDGSFGSRNSLKSAPKSTVKVKQGLLESNELSLIGLTHLDHASLEANSINLGGKLEANDCHFVADEKMHMDASTEKCLLRRSIVDAGLLEANTKLSCEEVELNLANMKLGKDAKVELKNSDLSLEGDFVLDGRLLCENTKLRSETLAKIGASGKLELRKKSEFQAKKLNHFGEILDSEGSQFTIDESTWLQDGSVLRVEDSHFDSLRFLSSVGDNCKVYAKNAHFKADRAKLSGQIELNQSSIDSLYIDLKGELKTNDSNLTAKKQIQLHPKKDHKFSLKKTVLNAQDIKLDGAALWEASRANAQYLLLAKEAALEITEHSVIETKDITADGSIRCESSTLKTEVFRGEGDVYFDSSELIAPGLGAVSVVGTTHIKSSKDTSRFTSRSISMSGHYDIAKAELNCTQLSHAGVATLTETTIKATDHFITKDAHVSMDKSKVSARITDSAGDLSLKDTEFHGAALLQSSGSLKLDDVRLRMSELVDTLSGSTFSAKYSEMNIARGVFKGASSMKASDLKAGALSFYADTHFDTTKVESTGHFSLSEGAHTLKSSKVVAASVDVGSHTTLSESSSLESQSTFFHGQRARLVVESDSVLKAKSYLALGRLELKHSTLSVQELKSYDYLKAESSTINVEDELDITSIATLEAEATELSVGKTTLSGKAKLKDTNFTVEKELSLKSHAHLEADKLKIKGAGHIELEAGSKVEGSDIDVTADTLTNRAELNVKKIKIDVEWLNNHGFMGGDSVELEVNKTLYNGPLARITGAKTTITATSLFNVAGHINGSDSLSMDTLVNVNAGGVYSGFNIANNSILSVNAGIMAPSMPTSMAALKDPMRWWRMGTMVATNFLPAYAGAINLASAAAPMALSAIPTLASGVQIAWNGEINKTVAKGWKEGAARASKFWSKSKDVISGKAKMKDVISGVLKAKSVAVSAFQTASTAYSVGKAAHSARASALKGTLRKEVEAVGADLKEKAREVSEGVKALKSGELKIEAFLPTAKLAASGAATVLGSSITDNSFLGINAGVAASVNLSRQDFVGVNTGVEAAATYVHSSAYGFANAGGIHAQQATLTGGQGGLHNSGSISASEKLNLNYVGEIRNSASGSMEARAANIEAAAFKTAGKTKLESGSLKARELKQEKTGDLELGRVKAEVDNASIAGSAKLLGTDLQVKDQLTLAAASTVDAEGAKLSAAKTTLAGQLKAAGTSIDTKSLKAEAGSESHLSALKGVGEDGSDTLVRSSIATTELNAAGQINLNQSKITAAETIAITAGGGIAAAADSTLKAENMLNAGRVDLEASKAIVTQKFSTEAGGVTDLKATQGLGDDGKEHLFSSSLEAAHIGNSGQMNLTASTAKASEAFRTEAGAVSTLAAGSKLEADKASVAGQVNLNQSTLAVAHDASIEAGGAIAAAADSTIKAENMSNAGRVDLEASKAIVTQKFSTEAGGVTDLKAAKAMGDDGKEHLFSSSLEAVHIGNSGQMNLTASTAKASEVFRTEAGAVSTLAAGSKLEADKASVAGQVNLNQSTLAVAHDASIEADGAIAAAADSTIKAENMSNAGRVDLEASKAIVTQKFSTEAGGVTDLKAAKAMGDDGKEHLFSSSLEAAHIGNSGQMNLTGSSATAAQEFRTELGGVTDLKAIKQVGEDGQAGYLQSRISADKVAVAGEMNLGAATVVKATGSFHNEATGRTHLEGESAKDSEGKESIVSATLEADTAHIEGNLEANNALLDVTQKLKLAENAKLKTYNAEFKGREIEHAAEHDFTGSLSMESKTKISTTATSAIRGAKTAEGASSVLRIKAESADFNGLVNADRGKIEVANLPNAAAYVEGTGPYARQHFNEALAVVTQGAVKTGEIKRDVDLSVTADSLDIGGFKHAERNLALNSTKGDVHLRGADNKAHHVGINSAGHVINTSNTSTSGQFSATAKGEFRNLGGNVNAGEELIIDAAAITNLTRASAEHARLARGSVSERALAAATGEAGSLSGKNTFLTARDGNIDNHGGVIKGTDYASLRAKGDIRNIANERSYRGKHDTMKEYTSAVISGGAGRAGSDDKTGLAMSAGGKIINDASAITAKGTVRLRADKGIDSTARSHTYVSDHSVQKKKFLGVTYSKKVSETVSTQVHKAAIGSESGKVIAESAEGGFHSVGSDLVSAHGTEIDVEGPVNLLAMKTQNRFYQHKSGFLGLNSSRHTESHEGTVETVMADRAGVSVVRSRTADVVARGASFLGDADLKIKADKGSILVASEIVNHEEHDKTRSFFIRAPGADLLKAATRNPGAALTQLHPVAGAVTSALSAQHPLEGAAAASNLAVHGANAVQALQAGTALSQMASRMTSVQIGMTRTETHQSSQTSSGSKIDRSNITFEAAKKVEIDGAAVRASGDISVDADELVLRAQALKSSYDHQEQGVSVSISVLTGAVQDASISDSRMHREATTQANASLVAGGNFHANLRKATLDGGTIDAKTMDGTIKELEIIDRQDSLSSSSQNLSASMSGAFAVGASSLEVKEVKTHSGIHVHQGINHDPAHQLSVGAVRAQGGYITTDSPETNHLNPESISATAVQDSRRGDGFNISANINTLSDAMAGSEKAADSAETFSVGSSKTRYAATHETRISGADALAKTRVSGSVSTAASAAPRVQRDMQYNAQFDVPIALVAQASQRAQEMAASAAREEMPVKPAENAAVASEEAPTAEGVEAAENGPTVAEETPSLDATEPTENLLPAQEGASETSPDSDFPAAAGAGDAGSISEGGGTPAFRVEKGPGDIEFLVAEDGSARLLRPEDADKLGAAIAALGQDTEESKKLGFPSFDLSTRKWGLGTGYGNRSQLFTKESERENGRSIKGQYTSAKTEGAKSQKQNKMGFKTEMVFSDLSTETTLIDERDSRLSEQTGLPSVVAAKASRQVKLKVDQKGSCSLVAEVSVSANAALIRVGDSVPLAVGSAPLGSIQYTADVLSADAKAKAGVKLENGSASAEASVAAGVMLASGTAGYDTPDVSVLGVKFNLGVRATAGCGVKAEVGAGATVDASKGKLDFYGKLGFFSGPGGRVETSATVAIDHEALQASQAAMQKETAPGTLAHETIQKLSDPKRMFTVSEFEQDSLDNTAWRAMPGFSVSARK